MLRTFSQLEVLALEAQERYFTVMRKRDERKYGKGVRGVKSCKYFFDTNRGKFMPAYYAGVHLIDDVIDGDLEPPEGMSRVEYAERKIVFARNSIHPQDDAEVLLLYCHILAEKMGEDFSEETAEIMESMLFDAKRQGTGTIFPAKELGHHFDLLDIRGTARIMLKIFHEDVSKYRLVEPLGVASRMYYNMRDFSQDIQAGLVNVTAEDFGRLGLSRADLHTGSPKIQRWFVEQSTCGLELLAQHDMNVKEGDFGWRSKVAFPLFYGSQAKKYFTTTLRNAPHLE
jgi:hypothetical protein